MVKDTALKLQKHSDFSFWNVDLRFEIEELRDFGFQILEFVALK